MWEYSGVNDPTRNYKKGNNITNIIISICDLSVFVNYILLLIDLAEKEVDARV